jgi:hypothetical protein
MKNPIFKAYEKLDDGIMYGVNKIVKTWNWTTGKDKFSLANYLLDFSLISYSLGAFSFGEPLVYPFVPVQMGITHILQKNNEQIQEKENNALQQKLKLDPSVYEEHKLLGITFGIYSGWCFYDYSEKNGGVHDFLLGAFGLSMCLSNYVMRAENLPPRKSAFKVAKEKLVALAEKYKPSSVPIPQPAFGFVRINNPHKTLESLSSSY